MPQFPTTLNQFTNSYYVGAKIKESNLDINEDKKSINGHECHVRIDINVVKLNPIKVYMLSTSGDME